MSRMLPVAGTSPFIVTTDDGKLFHCQPHEATPAGFSAAPRWIFIDTEGVAHIGPAYEGNVSPNALQRMLNDWWAARAEA